MLTSLAYIFILGLSLGYVFSRLKLPSLLGILLTGVILGPYFLNVLSPSLLSISVELRQIALVIILMRAGLALNIAELKKVGRPALLMCFVPACFEIIGITLIAPPLLGISTLEAAIMGAVVAAVSPAIIVPKMLFLMENKIGTKKSIPQMIMAGGSVDDVFVIVLFTTFTTLGLGGTITPTSFTQIPISIITGLGLGIGLGFILSKFFKLYHMRDSIKIVIMMSVAFLFLGVEEWLKGIVPLSGLLSVMAMGATVLKLYPKLATRTSQKFSKLWIAAEILLFVLVGATVDIQYALSAGIGMIVVIIFALICRMIGVYMCMIKTELNSKERLFCMVAYLPKATVQAAIGSLPLAMGLPCGKTVLTVAVLAIIITAPLGAFGIDMTYKRLLRSEDEQDRSSSDIPSDSISELGEEHKIK